MNKNQIFISCLLSLLIISCFFSGCVDNPSKNGKDMIEITDSAGRIVLVPDNPEKIAVSGSGAMRYFVYLNIDTKKAVAVDHLDSKNFIWDSEVRPYILAHPEIQNKDALGSSVAVVDNEILLKSGAEVLFLASGLSTPQTADSIQQKTGIPVVMFFTGNYATDSDKIDASLKMIGKIFHKEDRCKDVITYFNNVEKDLQSRVPNVSDDKKPSVYIAGISYRGSHGMNGSDPTYFPFTVLKARNVVSGDWNVSQTGYVKVSKEKILEWNPDMIFVDLGTRNAADGGALVELEKDPSYRKLSAVKNNQIYTVNPHTAMFVNHETTLANAYFIGKILYPDQFEDIDPVAKADEIYTFVDGTPVFDKLNKNAGGLSYQNMKI